MTEVTTEGLKEEFQGTENIGLGSVADGKGHFLMPEITPDDETFIEEIKQKFEVVLEWAKGLVIVDEASLNRATDIDSVLGKGSAALERRRVELLTPLNERKAQVHNAFKGLQDKIGSARDILRGQMTRHHEQIERKREAELEEAKRIEGAALTKEREAAIKNAARTGSEEDVDGVESIEQRQEALQEAGTTPTKSLARGKIGSSGISRIADREKIQTAIDGGVKAIPGVRIWQEWHFEITEARMLPDEYKKSSLHTR